MDDEYETVLKPKLSQYLAVLMKKQRETNKDLMAWYREDLKNVQKTVFQCMMNIYACVRHLSVRSTIKGYGKSRNPILIQIVYPVQVLLNHAAMPENGSEPGSTNPYDPKQVLHGANYISQQLAAFSVYQWAGIGDCCI